MQIFEYPYAIITIFGFLFILLAAIGMYFAAKGLKTAKGHTKNDFTTVSKMESEFKKLGKQKNPRLLILNTGLFPTFYTATPTRAYRAPLQGSLNCRVCRTHLHRNPCFF